jgi:hypothetical protein
MITKLGNNSRMGRPSRRGGHYLALGFRLALAAGAGGSLPACGPESYRQIAARDAHADLPGAGGNAGGGGGRGGAGNGGSDAATEVGYCPIHDGGASDAAMPRFNMSWTFDDATGLQGWSHVGQPPEVRDATTQLFDPDDGYPDPGSVRVAIPFNGASEQIAFGYNFPTPQDLSHQVLTARVRVNTCNGPGTLVMGLAYKSVPGVYEYAASNPIDVTASSGWITLTMRIDSPGGFIDTSHRDADGGMLLPDPTTSLEVDVIIQSNNGPYGLIDVSVDSVGLSDDPAVPASDAAPGDGPRDSIQDGNQDRPRETSAPADGPADGPQDAPAGS